MKSKVALEALEEYKMDRSRLLDILLRVQEKEGYINSEARKTLAEELSISDVDLDQTVSFYHV